MLQRIFLCLRKIRIIVFAQYSGDFAGACPGGLPDLAAIPRNAFSDGVGDGGGFAVFRCDLCALLYGDTPQGEAQHGGCAFGMNDKKTGMLGSGEACRVPVFLVGEVSFIYT